MQEADTECKMGFAQNRRELMMVSQIEAMAYLPQFEADVGVDDLETFYPHDDGREAIV